MCLNVAQRGRKGECEFVIGDPQRGLRQRLFGRGCRKGRKSLCRRVGAVVDY